MTRRLAVAFICAAVFASGALGAATPLAPARGAVVRTAHPQFAWALPANEQSEAIYIASKPDVTPEGKFYDENIVDIGIFTTDVRVWSPSSPLYAGRYWWDVWSTDRDTYASYYSTPTDFTIPLSLTLNSITTKRYRFIHWLEIDLRWSANTQRPLLSVRLTRKGRIVWKASEREYASIGTSGSTSLTWNRPRRIKQGTRLTLRASIASGGVTRSRAVVVRAP